jgi:carboxymethylenebutenolidase
MSNKVTFSTGDGFVSRPAAVVVIQEYWGIADTGQAAAIKDHVARWSREGFVAVAPDLYHGKVATNADDAAKLMQALDWGKAMAEIVAAVEWARANSNGKVAITGFCLGGALSFAAATQIKNLACVVPYYGLPPQGDWAKVEAPIQAHFAKTDAWATVDGAKKIQAAVPHMDLYVYEAEHAFCNARRPEVYNVEAASLAWARTVAFVRQHTA